MSHEIEKVDPMAQMYLHRLEDGIHVIQSLDSGKYPIDNYEGIPVKPNQGIKGLRYGISRKIFEAYEVLDKEFGLGDVAKEFIVFAAKMPIDE